MQRLKDLTRKERRELNRIVRRQRKEWKHAKARTAERVPAYLPGLRKRILGKL